MRLSDALMDFGLPVAQGALSTVIAVAPLAFLDSYILESFSSLIMLVVGLGLMHGLLFMPVALSLVSELSVSNFIKNWPHNCVIF